MKFLPGIDAKERARRMRGRYRKRTTYPSSVRSYQPDLFRSLETKSPADTGLERGTSNADAK